MIHGEEATDREIYLADLLRRTGISIGHLGQTVLDIEHHIMEGAGASGLALETVRDLQALDFLKQATDDIAALLDRVAEAIPQTISVRRSDLIDPMKLEELRDAIGSGGHTVSSDVAASREREIELF